ncbi:NADH-quinone oxidoreductase subunit C, partial [Halorubrum persicum]
MSTDARIEQAGADAEADPFSSIAELITARETHLNAPAARIRPDTVQEALSTLKREAGYDHLACVTAQEYENRYESIYHLRSFDDPTREVSVVVPADKNSPVSESAEP